MEEVKVFESSISAWNSPLVIVPKPDKDMEICIDYRKLNSITNRPVFHIPSSQEIFDKLAEQTVFSTLDLSKGYY